MKTLIAFFAIAASVVSQVDAAALVQSRSELVVGATVIAIVDIQEPEAAKPLKDFDYSSKVDPMTDGARGKEWSYSTQAKTTVLTLIKGEAPKNFILYGGESFICAQCTLAKGKYLAFLRKDGNCWAGSNWQASLRPIKDDQVEWFVLDDRSQPMKFQKLDKVIEAIRVVLKKQESEQGVAPNRSLPFSQKSTSTVRGPED